MAFQTKQDNMDDSGIPGSPRIVNGMPYRPRKVNLWEGLGFAGLVLVPDVLLLLAAIPLAVRGILNNLDSKGWLPSRPNASEYP